MEGSKNHATIDEPHTVVEGAPKSSSPKANSRWTLSGMTQSNSSFSSLRTKRRSVAELEQAEKQVSRLQNQLQSLMLDNKELAHGVRLLIDENKRLQRDNSNLRRQERELYNIVENAGIKNIQSHASQQHAASLNATVFDGASNPEESRHLLATALNSELEWYRHTLNKTLDKLACEEAKSERLQMQLKGNTVRSPPPMQHISTGSSSKPKRENVTDEPVRWQSFQFLGNQSTKKDSKAQSLGNTLPSFIEVAKSRQLPSNEKLGSHDLGAILANISPAPKQNEGCRKRTAMRHMDEIHSILSTDSCVSSEGTVSEQKSIKKDSSGRSSPSSTNALASKSRQQYTAHEKSPCANSAVTKVLRWRRLSADSAIPSSVTSSDTHMDELTKKFGSPSSGTDFVPLRPKTLQKLASLRRRRSAPYLEEEGAGSSLNDNSQSSKTVNSDPCPTLPLDPMTVEIKSKKDTQSPGDVTHAKIRFPTPHLLKGLDSPLQAKTPRASSESGSEGSDTTSSEASIPISKKQFLASLA